MEALMAHLRKLECYPAMVDSTITIEPYGVDLRLPDWHDIYIVSIAGYGVLGFLGDFSL